MLTIASFNIRYASAPDGRNRWELRRDLVIETIHSLSPDLLGLQECQDGDQAAFIRASLPEYGFTGTPRGGEMAGTEMTAILYRRAAFDLLNQGCSWLSETPAAPASRDWGAHFPRTLTWVHLRRAQPPYDEIFFFNTHFDYASELVLNRSAEVAAALIQAAAASTPAILVGDFNCEPDAPAHTNLLERLSSAGAPWFDALHQAGENRGSFHDYGRLAHPTAIDWIIASNHFTLHGGGVKSPRQNGRSPSDHDPVWVDVVY